MQVKAVKQVVTSVKPSTEEVLKLEGFFSDPGAQVFKGEIIELAKQLEASNGALSPTDLSQLRDYLQVSIRINQAQQVANKALQVTDLATWTKCMRILDGQTVLKRGLLRDMKMTRASKTSSTDTASEKKAKKGGADWKGLI
jgi:hypothetical protein